MTITKNEILTALNKPDDWILALVQVPPEENVPTDVTAGLTREERTRYQTRPNCQVRYLPPTFLDREPGFAEVSVNFNLQALWQRGSEPA